MNTVLLKVNIKNNDVEENFEVEGILNTKSNILIYDDASSTNVLDFNNNILKRKNKDIDLELRFDVEKPTLAKVFTCENSTPIFLNIKTLSIVKTDNKYSFKYKIEDQNTFEYDIEVLKI